ncbi:LacI family DNA-binding transcriptional regulator [Jannaschia rubra]|uniref:Gluconate utilization system GNT-I transcriptional repressor n=1 Tax=Jannaschia rubra TaxID=282197 RepID=A0A0M6XQN8_9RHOB|nr:LacI family DNA-binding transcriptional regulator [Jannaschia rubra]CTQ33208.1 Gluconate utilization system GNT-I transcriptional repressor [Jannaschia rubra]SFF96995.1 transcriptional regulator, LacI family [Jannaschia rubra]
MPRGRSTDTIGINDVARAAGVSLMTVSRSIRGVDGVSDATRQRIVRLAREMGYFPNSAARALAVTNSTLIGISLPTLLNDVFADVLSGMRRTLDRAGYSSVMDTSDYDPAREREWAERTLAWRPAALILTGTTHDPALRARLLRERLPVLEIWDVTDDPIDICVGIDHLDAGLTLARHVAALGYRRPAWVGAPPGLDLRADQRFRGLVRAFRDVGAREVRRVSVTGGNSFVAGAGGFGQLDLRDRPDVVFFLTDNMAFGGMMAAQKAGLSVPDDIGIVGFNGLDLTTVLPRPITTIRTPRRQIGVTGAKTLLARLNGLHPDAVTRLPCELMPGATVRMR